MRPENERIPQGVAMIHSYPWYFDDWLLSQTRMSMNSSERGIYRDVLDICYRDGKVPDDVNLLQRMLAVSAKEFRASWPAVRKQLVQVDGGLSHPRVVAELPDLQRLAEMRVSAGRTAARTRWAKVKHARSNAPGMRDACETQCEGDAISCPALTVTNSTSGATSSTAAPVDSLVSEIATEMRTKHRKKTGLGGLELERELCTLSGDAIDPPAVLRAIRDRWRLGCEREWARSDTPYWPNLLDWLRRRRYLDPAPAETDHILDRPRKSALEAMIDRA